MKSFKTYINEEFFDNDDLLLEAKDDPTKVGGVSNNTKGVLHEILVGKHLNGGKHMTLHPNEHGESPEQAHDRLKKQVHPEDYKKIEARAKSAASDIHKNLQASHPGHEIKHVHWTSKPGDTEKVTGVKASQKEDSSDLYVTTHHKKQGEMHHGVSLKVSDKSSKNVPSSSLGMKSSGEKAHDLFKAHQDKIKKANPELASIKKEPHHEDIASARKEWAEKNPQKHAEIRKQNQELLKNVAHHHAAELQHKLDSGQHEHVVNHIRDVLAAKSTPAAQSGKATFQKHTSYETAKGTQHHTADPGKDYEHYLKDHKKITVKASGGSVHYYHDGKKFASQAHKFDSQSDPLSTIKSAGKAV